MLADDVLGEVPPVRAEIERDLLAVVEQPLRVRHGADAKPVAAAGYGRTSPASSGRLVALVEVVGIEVLGDEESPGALGEREAVDELVVRGPWCSTSRCASSWTST